MQLVFAFLAKFAETAADGTLNVMGADFDRIAVGRFPAQIDIWVVAKFDIEPENIDERYRVSLALEGPRGHETSLGEREISAEGVPIESAKARGFKASMLVQIGLSVKEPGTYHVSVSVDGEKQKAWPIEIFCTISDPQESTKES